MSTPVRAVIVDDEPLARERLRMLLAGTDDVQIVGEFGDGRSAVAGIRELHPDLVFLDVQMPELDGFGVLHAIGAEHMPTTVFVTAWDRYALRAFDVSAVDYLLKPFDRERFQRALARARNEVGRNGTAQTFESLLRQVRTDSEYVQRLVVKSDGRIVVLRADEVDWVEAAGNYVRLHAGKQTHMLRETISALEGTLDPRRFVRIHRSALVNLERIKELHPLFHGDYVVILRDGSRLTLSRTYRENLEKALGRSI